MAWRTEFNVSGTSETLESKWRPNTKCPFSGHQDWGLIEEYVELRPYTAGGFRIGGGNIYPAVMVICNGCGYIALFSATNLGLIGASGEAS